MRHSWFAAVLLAASGVLAAENESAPDYQKQVAPILKKYCEGCHNEDFPEGKFSLETYSALQKGTKHGPAVLPGDPDGSRMIRVLTGVSKPAMPPKDEPKPKPEEIAVLEAWIASGARGPEGAEPDRLALIVPSIPTPDRLRPVTALAASPDGRWTAIAREDVVTLHEGHGETVTKDHPDGRTIGSFPGPVTALHFTPDGKRLVAASGVAGLGGVASLWNVEDGSLVRSYRGHRDLLYDAELSPDTQVLATCGYDKIIELRDTATGDLLRTLEGHTGAIYDVAFSPDGRFLVSASADDTCKVWRVEDGVRLDTLPQPLEAEYTCRFSPDGKTIVAGGADNNIRVWRFVSREKPEINPMISARFAHEGAIVRLEYSPDGSRIVTLAEDRTIKVWRTSDLTEIALWENQPDVVTALAFAPDGSTFSVGRLDGSLETYATPALPQLKNPRKPGRRPKPWRPWLQAPSPIPPTRSRTTRPPMPRRSSFPPGSPARFTARMAARSIPTSTDSPPGPARNGSSRSTRRVPAQSSTRSSRFSTIRGNASPAWCFRPSAILTSPSGARTATKVAISASSTGRK